MHKIDGFGHVNGQFVDEDVPTGRAPTVVTPEWLNAVQGELAAVVTDAGEPLDKFDNAQLLRAIKTHIERLGVPAGCVAYFAREVPPAGWLKANGALVQRAAYPGLFEAIGTKFGEGDGVSTFALPEVRGEFIRGWDDGRGVDSGRVLGSAQIATQILVDDDTAQVVGAISSFGNDLAALGYEPGNLASTVTLQSNNALGQTPAGSDYLRSIKPRNVAFLACIKC